jgi:SAM-dependent methyltransferase
MRLVRGRPWNRNIHYHDVVLDAVPTGCRRALDVGCGDGRLAAELAGRCDEVIAIDVHGPTLARARSGSAPPGLTFVEGDVMTYPLAEGSFDFIASIATLHHLPFEAALSRFRDLLQPGGVLAIIGLHRVRTVEDILYAPAAMTVSAWYRLTRPYDPVVAPMLNPEESLADVERRAARVLPDATFKRELLFRYSLIWRKP